MLAFQFTFKNKRTQMTQWMYTCNTLTVKRALSILLSKDRWDLKTDSYPTILFSKQRGIILTLPAASGEARRCRRSFATSRLPYFAATCRGVNPFCEEAKYRVMSKYCQSKLAEDNFTNTSMRHTRAIQHGQSTTEKYNCLFYSWCWLFSCQSSALK